MKKTVIGIGNALVDALVQVENDAVLSQLQLPKGSMQLIDTDRYHHIREWMRLKDVKRATGGSACNTILALAHLGERPALIGKISNDDNGRFFTDTCQQCGIQTHFIACDAPTGVASTFISPDGQRTFGTYLGAAAMMTADDMCQEWFEDYHYFYIEGYLVQNHDLMECAIEMAHRAGLKVCLDLASYNIVEAERDYFAGLLDKIDIVFANEEEAFAFTHKDPDAALDELASFCEVAVVKVGKDGSMARKGEYFAQTSALSVAKVVDTTAAGDFFAAGFLYNYARGRSLEECLYAGSVLAGNVIQVVGSELPEETWIKIREQV